MDKETRDKTDREIAYLYSRGYSWAQIRQACSCGDTRISRVLHSGSDLIEAKRKKRKIRDRAIVRRFLAGESVKKLGRLFNLSRGGVCEILRNHGAKRCSTETRREVRAEIIQRYSDEIVRRYAEGEPVGSIKTYYNLGTYTIRKIVRNAPGYSEIVLNRKVKRQFDTTDRNEQITRRHIDGESIESLAKVFGISRHRCRNIIYYHPIWREYCRNKRATEKDKDAEILKRFLAGESRRELVGIYGKNTTRRALIFTERPQNLDRDRKIVALRTRGWTLLKIGERYGMAESQVSRFLKRYMARQEFIRTQYLALNTGRYLQQKYGVTEGELAHVKYATPTELLEERRQKLQNILHLFYEGDSDEMIAEETGYPLEEVRNACNSQKRQRPDPTKDKGIWKPTPLKGTGTVLVADVEPKESTLELRPAEYARYLEVRRYRILADAERNGWHPRTGGRHYHVAERNDRLVVIG